MTLQELLESEGINQVCTEDCELYSEDRTNNFWGCAAQCDSDCPRLNYGDTFIFNDFDY